MNIYPILLVIIVIAGCIASRQSDTFEEAWNRKQGQMLQAAACLGVIIHHLSQEVTSYGTINKGPITIFASMGILFTSVFFFFSGYGLITSIDTKPDYIRNFLIHRLPIILIPFWIANIVGVLIRIYYEHIPTTPAHILQYVSGYILLNGNGWYIVEIFFLYIAFYISFRLVRRKDTAIILLIIATIAIIWIGYHNGRDASSLGDHWFKGEWWFNSTVTFIMGILFARYKSFIINHSKRHYALKLAVSVILFIVAFYIEEKIRIRYGYYHESFTIDRINSKLVTFTAQSILCIIWMYMLLLMSLKITIRSRLLKYISIISTELFLVHGYFVNNILGPMHLSTFAYFTLVFVCSILAASILHVIDSAIIRLVHVANSKSVKVSLTESKYIKTIANLFHVEQAEDSKECVLSTRSRITLVCTGVAAVLFLLTICTKSIIVSSQFKKEMILLENAQVGSVVTFGSYNTDSFSFGDEPLEWIVLRNDGKQMMLVTKLGIDGSVYYSKHTSVSWEESTIHSLLNDELIKDCFSKKERSVIIPNPDNSDFMSLLSAKEASELFANDEARQLEISDVAESKGVNINERSKVHYWDEKGYRSSWWWLRGDDMNITAPIVSVDGDIRIDEKYVNKPNGAVRPVIWIRLNSSQN